MRFVVAIISLLAAAPAWAFLPGHPVGMLNPQVQPSSAIGGLPAIDDKLSAGGYPVAGGICAEWGHQVPCNNHYAVTRASPKYVSASDGLYASVPANVLALGAGNGALIEETRTNDALWARDMTNAVWVATTMTTALNAVGIDGAASSATTLTATGANATILQTITLASQADNYSVFLKRVTGSGAIRLCLAATACGTATACTVTSTTTFVRCSVTATVLNPIVGIQIATSGDAVIADFNQMEPGGFVTSPIIATTTVASQRSSDNVNAAGMLAIVAATAPFSIVVSTGGSLNTNPRIVNDHTDAQTQIWHTASAARSAPSSGQIIATIGGSLDVPNAFKTAVGYDASGGSIVAANGTVATGVNAWTSVSIPPRIGSSNATASFYDGYLAALRSDRVKFGDTILKAMTQ